MNIINRYFYIGTGKERKIPDQDLSMRLHNRKIVTIVKPVPKHIGQSLNLSIMIAKNP